MQDESVDWMQYLERVFAVGPRIIFYEEPAARCAGVEHLLFSLAEFN